MYKIYPISENYSSCLNTFQTKEKLTQLNLLNLHSFYYKHFLPENTQYIYKLKSVLHLFIWTKIHILLTFTKKNHLKLITCITPRFHQYRLHHTTLPFILAFAAVCGRSLLFVFISYLLNIDFFFTKFTKFTTRTRGISLSFLSFSKTNP